MIPTFIGITALVFTILQVVPGGPFEQELLRFKMASMASSEGGAGGGGSGVGGSDFLMGMKGVGFLGISEHPIC